MTEHTFSDVPNIKPDCIIREIKYINGIVENKSPATKVMLSIGQKDFNQPSINQACDTLAKSTISQNVYLHCFFERRLFVWVFDTLTRLRIIVFLIRKSSTFNGVKLFTVKEDMLYASPLFPRYPKRMLSCNHYLSFRFWINEIIFVVNTVFLKPKISVVVKCH